MSVIYKPKLSIFQFCRLIVKNNCNYHLFDSSLVFLFAKNKIMDLLEYIPNIVIRTGLMS